MSKISQAQLALLTAAAEPEGVAAAPETARTAGSLIKRGLLISLPRTGAPSRLLITDAGRGEAGLPLETAEPEGRRAKAKAVRGASVQAPSPQPAPEPSSNAKPGPEPAPKGKLGAVVALMQRQEGADVATMMAATGWQAHSVRGAIAGAIKKKLGFVVSTEPGPNGRVYRITDGAGA